jgi:hypothetical protein
MHLIDPACSIFDQSILGLEMTSSADPRFTSYSSPNNLCHTAELRIRGNEQQIQLDRSDLSTIKRWRFWVFLFYAAVSSMLVGLALADHPGTATVASAQLGQTTAIIHAGTSSR